MKILFVNTVCGIRSTGRICTDMARALIKNGHSVRVAYGREKAPTRDEDIALRIGTDHDVRLHALYARLFDGAGFGSRRATERFCDQIEGFDPDLIHLHNLHGYYLHLEVLFDYLKSSGRRVIWTLHDGWAFAGHSATCDAEKCEKWRTGCGGCPLKSTYPKSYLDFSHRNWERKRQALTGVKNLQIVTPSRYLASQARESFLGEYPVQVIPNGIDTRVFRPTPGDVRERYGIGEKVMLLGVSTQWDDMKGLPDYIRLAGMLPDRYQMVLVGVPPRVKKTLPEGVIALERTDSPQELAALYTAADLVINLSRCENYPTVNLEAMACGTRVLTWRVGGSPESVEGFGGLVVPRGDMTEVMKCLESIGRKQNGSGPLRDPEEIDSGRAVKAYERLYFDQTGAMA